MTFGLGILTSGSGVFLREGIEYSGSSASGYQISSFFSQQRGFWEIFLGLTYGGKYYYDLSSNESKIIHDRWIYWVNFLIGIGVYY